MWRGCYFRSDGCLCLRLLPAIGGAADYIDQQCGILVSPDSRSAMVSGFKDALLKLANEPQLAVEMGVRGRQKIEVEYDWERKIDKIMQIYQQLLADTQPSSR